MKLRAFFLAIAGLVVVSLFFSTPSQAEAATAIAPDAPRPVNVLPSTAAALRTTGIATPAATQAWVYYLYNAAKTPEFWQAVNAQKSGTATAGQLTLVQQAADDFKVPATKAASLLKVAGGVGVALTGLEVGGMMGNGALELFGFDVDGTVCPNTGTDPIGLVAEWASNADCTAWDLPAEFIPNTDSPGGFSVTIVDNRGRTLTYTGKVPRPIAPQETPYYWCFTSTNPDDNANGSVWFRRAGSSGAGESITTQFGSSACPVTNDVAFMTVAGRTSNGSPLGTFTPYDFEWSTTGSGSWSQPASSSADPDRTISCQVTGSDGIVYDAQTETFRESMVSAIPAPVCPVLPPEVYPERIKIDELGGPQPAELYNEPTTPEYQQFQQTFPDCDSGTCMLDLLKNDKSCFQTPADCLDWFSDPNKTSTYSCTYGSVAVDLAECNVYAPSFTSDPSAGTQYGDPTTGEALPSTVPNTRDAQYSNGSVADPSQPRQCMPTGWGVLNPIEWVLRPVQCALEWAFVPRQSVIEAQLGTLLPLYVDTMPGQLHLAVSDWSFTAPPTNCNGITLDMSWIPGQTSVQMLNACPGDPLEPFAGWAKFFFYVAFTVVGTLGSIRNAAATIGYRGIGGDS